MFINVSLFNFQLFCSSNSWSDVFLFFWGSHPWVSMVIRIRLEPLLARGVPEQHRDVSFLIQKIACSLHQLLYPSTSN